MRACGRCIVYRNIKDIFLELDLTGNILEVSQSIDQLGYNKEDLIKKNIFNVGLIKKRLFDEFLNYIKSDDDNLIDSVLYDKNGVEISVEISVIFSDGIILCMIRDVSTRKTIISNLMKYKLAINSSDDIIVALDLDYKYLFANKTFLNKFGLTKKDIFRKTSKEIIGEKTFNVLKPYLDRCFKGELVRFEQFIDGKYYAFKYYPVKSEKIVGVVGIVKDITKQKKLELEILNQKDKFEKYLNLASVMMVALDKQGNISYMNYKACGILKCGKEVVGKNWFDNFLPGNVRNDVKKYFLDIIAGKLEFVDKYENEILCSDGSKKLIAWENILLKDVEGNVLGTLASGRDITEERRLQLENQYLLKKLKKHNLHLKKKIKKLEKLKYSLNDKEKKVLYSLCKHPLKSDEALSSLIGIKRSTVNSIRNNLRKNDYFFKANFPDFGALGVKKMSFRISDKIRDNEFELFSGDKSIFLSFSNNFLDQESIYIRNPGEVMVFNTATSLANLFGYENKSVLVNRTKTNLTNNDKLVMEKMFLNPDISIKELVEKTKLSKPTVIKIKNKLYDERWIVPVIMPNYDKLGSAYMVLLYCEMKEDVDLTKFMNYTYFNFENKYVFFISFFYNKQIKKFEDFLNENSDIFVNKPVLKKIYINKYKKWDFSSIFKDILQKDF